MRKETRCLSGFHYSAFERFLVGSIRSGSKLILLLNFCHRTMERRGRTMKEER